MRRDLRLSALAALGLSACATTPPPDPARGAPVRAVGQTTPVLSRDDAADDPAIWRNPADPEASLIVATDKQFGLYVTRPATRSSRDRAAGAAGTHSRSPTISRAPTAC